MFKDKINDFKEFEKQIKLIKESIGGLEKFKEDQIKFDGCQRYLELIKPENRRVLQAYMNAEVRRLDQAVYSPLEKKDRSLGQVLGEMRKGYSPVEKMQKEWVQMLETVKGIVGLIYLIKGDKDAQAVKRLEDKIEPFSELNKKFVPMQEQFYVDLAHAIKGVSTQRGIGVNETVKDLQYMDEVSRVVIPIREEAESFLKTSQLYNRTRLDIVRGYFTFSEKVSQADEKMLAEARLIPDAKVMEAIQKGIWNYEMQKFDRVYFS